MRKSWVQKTMNFESLKYGHNNALIFYRIVAGLAMNEKLNTLKFPLPPMYLGVDICRSIAENIRCKEFEISKSTLWSVKKTFLFNALMSIYTIYKMDDFEQMESFSKIFIFTLTFKHFSENKTFPSFLRPFLAKLHQFYEEPQRMFWVRSPYYPTGKCPKIKVWV